MNKNIILSTLLVLVVALSVSSCKRRHLCICDISGPYDTVLRREYRGYSANEARKLCKSEENASSAVFTWSCDIR